jgi:hypothetical protein
MKQILRSPAQRADCIRQIQSLPIDKAWEVEIKPWRKKRTLPQNSRHWPILTDISEQVADENGKHYAPEVWHRYFLDLFWGKDTIMLDGKPVLVSKSSTDLDVPEFSDWDTQIESWGVEHGVRFTADMRGQS